MVVSLSGPQCEEVSELNSARRALHLFIFRMYLMWILIAFFLYQVFDLQDHNVKMLNAMLTLYGNYSFS